MSQYATNAVVRFVVWIVTSDLVALVDGLGRDERRGAAGVREAATDLEDKRRVAIGCGPCDRMR